MDIPAKKIAIAREQLELTNLMSELENSVAVVKEQINTLTVYVILIILYPPS